MSEKTCVQMFYYHFTTIQNRNASLFLFIAKSI
jgi:hypothetical protein